MEHLWGAGHWEGSPGNGELESVWKSGLKVRDREIEKVRVGSFQSTEHSGEARQELASGVL